MILKLFHHVSELESLVRYLAVCFLSHGIFDEKTGEYSYCSVKVGNVLHYVASRAGDPLFWLNALNVFLSLAILGIISAFILRGLLRFALTAGRPGRQGIPILSDIDLAVRTDIHASINMFKYWKNVLYGLYLEPDPAKAWNAVDAININVDAHAHRD